MTQTTTARNACDVVLAIDDDDGVLVDASGTTNQVDMTFTHNVGEGFTLGSEWAFRLICGKDATMAVIAFYSTAAAESWSIVGGWWHLYDGAARTVRVDFPNADGGSDRYLGEWILVDYNHVFTAGEGGPIQVTYNLLPSGEIQHLEIGT